MFGPVLAGIISRRLSVRSGLATSACVAFIAAGYVFWNVPETNERLLAACKHGKREPDKAQKDQQSPSTSPWQTRRNSLNNASIPSTSSSPPRVPPRSPPRLAAQSRPKRSSKKLTLAQRLKPSRIFAWPRVLQTPALRRLALLTFLQEIPLRTGAIFSLTTRRRFNWDAEATGRWMFIYGAGFFTSKVVTERMLRRAGRRAATRLTMIAMLIGQSMCMLSMRGKLFTLSLLFFNIGLTKATLLRAWILRSTLLSLREAEAKWGKRSSRIAGQKVPDRIATPASANSSAPQTMIRNSNAAANLCYGLVIARIRRSTRPGWVTAAARQFACHKAALGAVRQVCLERGRLSATASTLYFMRAGRNCHRHFVDALLQGRSERADASG